MRSVYAVTKFDLNEERREEILGHMCIIQRQVAEP